MADRKPQKPQLPSPASTPTKPTVIALKPRAKAQETPPESHQEVVEPPAPVEPPKKAHKPIKPIKQSPATSTAQPLPDSEPDSESVENSNAIFQAIGVIVGDVLFDDKKAYVALADKQYSLYYSSSHKKAFEALRLQVKTTGQTQQRLIVYPKVMHFPKRDQLYRISFQLVGFNSDRVVSQEGSSESDTPSIDRQLQDGEFKLSGLWQFIPVCSTPCITVQKNFTAERLAHIKEAPVEQKVRFLKASHIPVLWRDAPVRPFRFNPKLDKQQQGQASFVGIKANFLPQKDVFTFCSLEIPPTNSPPKFLKAGKKDKAQAMQAKNQRQRQESTPVSSEQ
ncbi:MAG TPA: hypothetical protein V6D50_04890 [Chroococcales cyanobacterium]|jgi:hypothetical protein